MIKRREWIVKASLITISAVSGCADFPSHREISIGEISAQQHGSSWKLKLSVVNDNTIGDAEANFHNVVIHVYSVDGNEVGKRKIGTLTYEYNVNHGKELTVKCRSFPYLVTFDAEERPCEENTDIMIGRYDGKQEGEFIWATEYRECEEGLPPNFSTPVSPPDKTDSE